MNYSGKRKLSFLSLTPLPTSEDQVLLDDEMERVVWGVGHPPRLQTARDPYGIRCVRGYVRKFVWQS
ncbi:unnamed protein product [Leptidea sinapis]|uniref:Uncharacterized protein n=1 Tax=Leptidea sinapis TaxID=189913 RepID=A0A5E4PME8_9NEOP|nr:unnamed protein product [Leptidea sinapis]